MRLTAKRLFSHSLHIVGTSCLLSWVVESCRAHILTHSIASPRMSPEDYQVACAAFKSMGVNLDAIRLDGWDDPSAPLANVHMEPFSGACYLVVSSEQIKKLEKKTKIPYHTCLQIICAHEAVHVGEHHQFWTNFSAMVMGFSMLRVTQFLGHPSVAFVITATLSAQITSVLMYQSFEYRADERVAASSNEARACLRSILEVQHTVRELGRFHTRFWQYHPTVESRLEQLNALELSTRSI